MKFTIDTDLTVAGTKMLMDGNSIEDNIASISFMADAPNKKYDDSGYIGLNITTFDSDGNIKRTAYSLRKDVAENYKPIGVEDWKKDDVIRYIGSEIDMEKKSLVDSIIKHCAENNIKCPAEDVLLARTTDSLKDKLTDLGVSIDNAE